MLAIIANCIGIERRATLDGAKIASRSLHTPQQSAGQQLPRRSAALYSDRAAVTVCAFSQLLHLAT